MVSFRTRFGDGQKGERKGGATDLVLWCCSPVDRKELDVADLPVVRILPLLPLQQLLIGTTSGAHLLQRLEVLRRDDVGEKSRRGVRERDSCSQVGLDSVRAWQEDGEIERRDDAAQYVCGLRRGASCRVI